MNNVFRYSTPNEIYFKPPTVPFYSIQMCIFPHLDIRFTEWSYLVIYFRSVILHFPFLSCCISHSHICNKISKDKMVPVLQQAYISKLATKCS